MTFLSATWTIAGYDVAAHVAEETSNAAITVPRAMIWSTWSSVFLGFVYLISLALCATDIDSLMADPLGQPIGTLMADVLGTKGGIALMAINAFTQFACGVAFVSRASVPSLSLHRHSRTQLVLLSQFVAASRIYFAYSRDRALPFSDWISRVSPRTQTPNNASLVVFLLSAAFGVISIGSDTAFQAFFPGSTLAGQIGYILPVLGRCLYEDNPEYRNGAYNLGRFSRAIRWTAVAWNVFITLLVSL